MSQPDDGFTLGDQVDALRDATTDNPGWQEAHEGGELGEAISGAFIGHVDNGYLLDQHAPGDKPQGVDKTYLNDAGDLVVAEDKTNVWGEWGRPSMSPTGEGRQMGDSWLEANLEEAAFQADSSDFGTDPGDVHREVFQTDIVGGTFARYGVDSEGAVDADPAEVYALDDILGVSDSWQEAVGDDPADGFGQQGVADDGAGFGSESL